MAESEDELRAIAFPKLSDNVIASIARVATCKTYHDGEKLFEVGEKEIHFFVVKSGQIEIIDRSGDKPNTVTIHHEHEFSGDVSHLTGNPAVVEAVARGDVDVYEVKFDDLKQLINQSPEVSDVLLRAFIARRQLLEQSGKFTGPRVIGSRYSPDTFRVRDFLARNRILFTWLDLEDDPQVVQMLKQFNFTEADTPVVSCGNVKVQGKHLLLRNPSNRELAERLGIRRPITQRVHDLAIIGAGPAGLAAAVYAASEGLGTIVLESVAPGGQAGTSMRIENYLGFPTGITGADLTNRAVLQADKFGAQLSTSSPVVGMRLDDGPLATLLLDGGEQVEAKSVLIATGAEYRRLDVAGREKFEGAGVYYAATPVEAQSCVDADVVIVGAGNSAGQAAVFMATRARKVFLLVRGDNLTKSMSSYLASRIERTENIELLCNTEIIKMHGDGYLSEIDVQNKKAKESRTLRTPAVFCFIGAVPRTQWLPKEIATDEKGFILTGRTVGEQHRAQRRREPYLLETSRPGIFAAGDVRRDSIKRVASAVGEGSMVVHFVHQYLGEV